MTICFYIGFESFYFIKELKVNNLCNKSTNCTDGRSGQMGNTILNSSGVQSLMSIDVSMNPNQQGYPILFKASDESHKLKYQLS